MIYQWHIARLIFLLSAEEAVCMCDGKEKEEMRMRLHRVRKSHLYFSFSKTDARADKQQGKRVVRTMGG
jgi:hypothetical protein